MSTFFSMLFFFATCLLLIGLFNPKTSLFWYKKERTKKTSTLIYAGAMVLCIILSVASAPPTTQAEKDALANERKEKAETEDASTKVTTPKVPGIGEPIQTEYFIVQVNSFDFKDKISTGNEFADLKKEPGNKYIVINVSLKNIDNESRMMFDGELRVKNGSQEIKYDKAEMVMLEGWGILMETINPGVSKTTNIVYKVPEDMHGDVYYLPSRSSDDNLIKVATL